MVMDSEEYIKMIVAIFLLIVAAVAIIFQIYGVSADTVYVTYGGDTETVITSSQYLVDPFSSFIPTGEAINISEIIQEGGTTFIPFFPPEFDYRIFMYFLVAMLSVVVFLIVLFGYRKRGSKK